MRARTKSITENQRSSNGGWVRTPRGERLRQALSRVTNLVMPPVCLSCYSPLLEHHTVCAECWSGITFIQSPVCDRLGLPLPYDVGDVMVSAAAVADPPLYDRARAIGIYSGTLKKLIHDFKFRDRQELRCLLARWLFTAGAPFWPDADFVVPVPLHRTRLLKRRFNQASVLAYAVAREAGLPVLPQLLVRTRATAQQVGLTLQQRRDNVRGAFQVHGSGSGRIGGARIVLLDDVITTGATVSACAKVLCEAGAAQIDVVSVALTVPGADDRDAASGVAVEHALQA